MKTLTSGLILACLLGAAGVASAADEEAGVPLAPNDAAGAWSLESGGHTLCVLRLGAAKAAGGYALQAPASCQGDLPSQPVAWTPTRDGMGLVGADGSTLIRFSRWSNSLFVSHRSSGVDVQLRRGGPNAG